MEDKYENSNTKAIRTKSNNVLQGSTIMSGIHSTLPNIN